MSDSVRVLLVDDDESAYVMTRGILARVERPRIELEWARSQAEALEKALAHPYDVYLVDYYLEEHTGLDFLRASRERGIQGPMVMLTAHGDRSLDLQAMDAGASDYLVKGEIDPGTLERSIRYAVERQRAADALRRREEQLQRAQRMDAVVRMAGGIAHDFNNLLTAIAGYAQLAVEGLHPSHVVRDDLLEIGRAVDRARYLTDQLLAFSRKQILRPSPFDLGEWTAGLGNTVQHLTLGRVSVAIEPGTDPVPVRADQRQLEQAVANLVFNAVEAMPHGGELRIRAGVEEVVEAVDLPPGSYGVLEVADSGEGMTAETLAHSLEPFFTTKDPARHPGLGLATVYGIVRQSRGTVTVSSGPGIGTTVRLLLPLDAEAAEAEPAPPLGAGTAAGPGTVLLAEDDVVVRRLLERVLERQGFRVISGSNGQEAIERAERFSGELALVVTDVVMPVMTGPELARRIQESRPGTKILFISGYTEDQTLAEDVRRRLVPFLQKPFTTERFLSQVARLLDASAPPKT